MRTFKKSTEEEIGSMIDLFARKVPVSAIARETRKDRSTIYYWAKKLQVEKGSKRKKTTKEEALRELKLLKVALGRLQTEVSEAPYDRLKALDTLIRGKDFAPFTEELLERGWFKYDKLNEIIKDLIQIVGYKQFNDIRNNKSQIA